MAKAPRTFKVPFGPVIPVLGIIGNVFMIVNIDGDPATRLLIYEICLGIFLVLGVYAAVWIKKVMKKPMFKAVPMKEVMAMENDLYMVVRRKPKTK